MEIFHPANVATLRFQHVVNLSGILKLSKIDNAVSSFHQLQ